MKIAIIGATGGTGRHFLKLAAEAGHDVTALARTPSKLEDEDHPRLRIVRADGRDLESLTAALEPDFDLVVNIVGAATLWEARKVLDLYSVTSKNLIDAMKYHGLRRLVTVSSSGVEPQANDNWFYVHVLKRFFLNPMYDDMLRMEALIATSGLDYTVVRPPYLTSGKQTGTYRVCPGQNFEDDTTLSRADLAHFLLRAAQPDPAWVRNKVALSY